MDMIDQYSESSDEGNKTVPVKKERKMSKQSRGRKCETIVKLTGRNMTTVPPNKLKKYERCFGFDLSDNRINFTDDLCSYFMYIRYLNLSNNFLETLPQEIFMMQHLIHFDISHNNISALPFSMKALKNLLWLDLRGNPFMELWNKMNHPDAAFFDPKDVKLIITFLDAVTVKYDMLVQQRAEDFRDFILINSGKFLQKEETYEECPFHDMSKKHPQILLQTLQVLEDCQVNLFTYPEKWIMWGISKFFNKVLPWLAGNLILILLLSATFYDDSEFHSGLKHFEKSLPTFVSTFLDQGRSTILEHLPWSIKNLFPIRPPI